MQQQLVDAVTPHAKQVRLLLLSHSRIVTVLLPSQNITVFLTGVCTLFVSPSESVVFSFLRMCLSSGQDKKSVGVALACISLFTAHLTVHRAWLFCSTEVQSVWTPFAPPTPRCTHASESVLNSFFLSLDRHPSRLICPLLRAANLWQPPCVCPPFLPLAVFTLNFTHSVSNFTHQRVKACQV